MPGSLHVVFNRPPSDVSDAEFNRWAFSHFGEILAVPGWLTARRFRLESAYSFPDSSDYAPPESADRFGYMSLYEIGGDVHEALDALREESSSGRMDLPPWFQRAQDEGCFASWNAIPIERT